MSSSLEKGVGDVRSNCASRLSVFVSVAVHMIVADGLSYANNGDSFNGILEADGLVFGVLGHCGWLRRLRRLSLRGSGDCLNDSKVLSGAVNAKKATYISRSL